MKMLKRYLVALLLSSAALNADITSSSNASNEAQVGVYTFPGFIYQRDGEWMGSDYLYNLSNDIGLIIDVLLPPNEKIEVNKQKLTTVCVDAFKKYRINARTDLSPGISALPFFYLQIMVFPTDLGNVTMCCGSLFESATLSRITLVKDTALQAITWEKKTMFMSIKENFETDLTKTIDDIANTFGVRYRLFEKNLPKDNKP